MKSQVGHSIAADAHAAGVEAAQMAKEGLQDIKLAFVYSSVDYDLAALLAGVREQLPGVPLIGNTSFTGVVCADGYIAGDDGFVGIMVISDPEAVISVAGLPKGTSARETGQDVAHQAM